MPLPPPLKRVPSTVIHRLPSHLHPQTRSISILPSSRTDLESEIKIKGAAAAAAADVNISITTRRYACTTPSTRDSTSDDIKMTLTHQHQNQQHSAIISQVGERFAQARESGDLLFFPSEVHLHDEAGIQFQIRLCPALQQKPRLPTPHFDDEQSAHEHGAYRVDKHPKKPDPFAPPYIPNLLVGELRDEEEGEEFAILLNKYSVVPNHFLMVTKEYKSQTSPLFPAELVQTYLLLDAARRAGKDFFAFYNCGDVSGMSPQGLFSASHWRCFVFEITDDNDDVNEGASQPHKHIQFLPVDDDGPPIERLARTVNLGHESRAFTFNSLPFAAHVRRLPSSLASSSRQEMEDILGEAFMMLLDLAISTVRHDPAHPAGQPSYNVILTRQHMYLVPRKREEHILRETGDPLSVNALGFAGLLLVKSERELDAVKRESVVEILKDVALENVHDQQIVGEHDVDAET
ncbi:APA2 [Sanghuangporus weigelae]